MGKYTQCKLQKDNTFTTSYIPSEFAKKNNIIGIKKNGVWEEGWKIVSIGATLDAKYVEGKNKHFRRGIFGSIKGRGSLSDKMK
jgi:hypothetical protein